MNESIDFNKVAGNYERKSIVQKGAAEILLSLIKIKSNESVLDAGCGPGNLTRKIKDLTKGRVAGVDVSQNMINEALGKYGNDSMEFYTMDAEELGFKGEFDVIFSNSAFQWSHDPLKACGGFYRALKKGGRVGIQAPGGGKYCDNFMKAVEHVKTDYRTSSIFSKWKNPWFMAEKADDYSSLFEKSGFLVKYSEIRKTSSCHTAAECFDIFSSGAITGYLNREYYNVEINPEYIRDFKSIVINEFENQAMPNNNLELNFNRIFLVAVKP